MLGTLLIVLAVAADSYDGPPTPAYSRCTPAAPAAMTDPDAHCDFHGTTVTVGEYQMTTLPQGSGTP